ncbi:hypothetical protein LZ30DRAFT_730447 [Colletotrichum cereale]|nr:hypothetical protein LZ30DRAFT_730447 [Colletotrichum cereale]
MKLLKLLSSLESVCCHTLDPRGAGPLVAPCKRFEHLTIPRCNLDQTPELPPLDQSSCLGHPGICCSGALLPPYPYSVSPLCYVASCG